MLIQILISLVIGIIAGTITGLIPGLHINLVGAILSASSAVLINYLPVQALAVFLLSTAMTHTFVDAIPSTLLGVPNADTAEMILPAHKMVIDGEGYEAVRLATMGGLVGVAAGLLVFYGLVLIIPLVYETVSSMIGYILLIVSAYFILTESDNNKRFWAAVVFGLSGVLGMVVLGFPNLEQPLLPMLSGLFGISTMLISLIEPPAILDQIISQDTYFEKRAWVRITVAMLGSAWLASLLPGLGTAQATLAAKSVLPKDDAHAFLVSAGGINTLNYLFSLATWFSIGKQRNGAVVVMAQLIEKLSARTVMLFVCAAVIVSAIAAMVTLGLGRIAAKKVGDISYKKICLFIIIFLVIMVAMLCSWKGMVVLIVSTALGMVVHYVGVRKSSAMGCLMIPVMVFFLS